MKFVDPKNDIAFRKIFGDENNTTTLISFLNAILKLKGKERIKTIEILSPFQLPRIKDLKESILDVKAVDNLDREFIIEMQVENKPYMEQRVLYYTSKSYVGQIKRSEKYENLRPVIFIGILEFNMFDSQNYLSKFLITNEETSTHEFKDFELHFIELKKFTKAEADLKNIVDKWVYFIKNADEIDEMPKGIKDSGLREAYETAKEYLWTQKELDLYDYAGMLKTDRKGELQFARDKAMREGRAAGMEEGRAAGMEEGREEGRDKGIKQERRIQEQRSKQNMIEIATKMIQEGLDDKTVSRITALSVSVIQSLRN
ncbi:Rpn family recombination-promoting nuclease/putative transposase [bacterium]|nr:Rpn family recombination-promoting nuclease/putative transposase [bacterium]